MVNVKSTLTETWFHIHAEVRVLWWSAIDRLGGHFVCHYGVQLRRLERLGSDCVWFAATRIESRLGICLRMEE